MERGGAVKRLKKDNQGFTLIEIVISIAIFAIVAIPLIVMISTASKNAHDTKTRAEATLAAQNAMEDCKAYYQIHKDAETEDPWFETYMGTLEGIQSVTMDGQTAYKLDNVKGRFDVVYSASEEATDKDEGDHSRMYADKIVIQVFYKGKVLAEAETTMNARLVKETEEES